VTATEATRTSHRPAFLAAAAGVVALDQLTKAWAVRALEDGPIDLVGSLRLRLVWNDGAAFSLISGRTTVVALLALAVSVVVLVVGLRAEHRSWALVLGVIYGGAAGNLVDRVIRDGEGFMGGRVVDFVDLQWYPVFNVADVAIVVGVGLALLLSFREPG
jgi:signal peptidase II